MSSEDDKDLLDTVKIRLQAYAEEILETTIYNIKQGLEIPSDSQLNNAATIDTVDQLVDCEEDDDGPVSLNLNPFELFARVVQESGFPLREKEPAAMRFLLEKLEHLFNDAGGWFYVPLGETDLEFIDKESWQLLYKEWLRVRAEKRRGTRRRLAVRTQN